MTRPARTLTALRAAWTLHRQRMPLDEIRALLTTNDPEIVHRYLELHCERLEERLAAQRDTLASISSGRTFPGA